MRFLAPLIALFMFLWSHAALAAPSWRLTEVAGPVRIQKDGLVRPAARGATLAPGEGVITGAGGRAVLVRGEEMVVVFPGSRLRVPDAAEQDSGIIQMIQDLGDAIYKIQKKATPHFGVRTPYLAAVVKGTTFKVSSGPAGAAVRVMEGRVEVATNDGRERRMVVPGHVARVAPDKPAEVVEEVDADDADDQIADKKDKSDKEPASAAAENRNERSLDNPSVENRNENSAGNRSSDKSNNRERTGLDMRAPQNMSSGIGPKGAGAAAALKRTAEVAKKAEDYKVKRDTTPDKAPTPPKQPTPPAPQSPPTPPAPPAPPVRPSPPRPPAPPSRPAPPPPGGPSGFGSPITPIGLDR